MRDEDESDYLMSLNDTLTCGFGATVLLFVVFVVLVSLQDAVRHGEGELYLDRDTLGASLNPLSVRTKEPLMIAINGRCETVTRIQPDPRFDKNKTPENPEAFEIVDYQDKRNNSIGWCVRLFRRAPTYSVKSISFDLSTSSVSGGSNTAAPVSELRVSVLHGGQEITVPPILRSNRRHVDGRAFTIRLSDSRRPFKLGRVYEK